MKNKLLEHGYSVAAVGVVLFAAAWILRAPAYSIQYPSDPLLSELAKIDSLQPEKPLHRALLKESLDAFYPDQSTRNDSLINAFIRWRRDTYIATIESARIDLEWSWKKFYSLTQMYGMFIVAFVVVIASIYFGSPAIGLYQFIRNNRNRSSDARRWNEACNIVFGKTPGHRSHAVRQIASFKLKWLLKGIAYAVLFSPAYVVAYSFKTNFETDSLIFLIALGFGTNGLLITSAYKFFTILTSESRKGYVETARVKGLSDDYAHLPFQVVLQPGKYFSNHVAGHIYKQALFQYRPSLKELASFVVTGLVIIEMALNIQGHLGYELLKNTLYKNWDVVIVIIFGIFLLVKLTEAAADIWHEHEINRYENQRT
ncbi:hypothetical protein K1X84_16880 [bacterium]|nr:hypothetical protein [bacterium]